MKNKVNLFLSGQAQCVLATINNQQPYLHLMAYAFSADLCEIYMASLLNTQKVHNMRNCPDVTCLWDNRTGNFSDHIGGFAMSGFGKAVELTGEIAASKRNLLLERNATLSGLLAESSVVVFAVHIDRYQWVEGYTKSMIFEPNHLPFN
jgi:nitroimidazol reductase NimA-like FMN-containing flavoprotein (pyridoxamine 5'-phosphate oxidase superfamily)